MRPAGDSVPESCVRSVAGVELGEEMAVEATLELDIAEEVRVGAVARDGPIEKVSVGHDKYAFDTFEAN